MKELTSEHPELERQIIETVEAGNVLDDTQQHEQALIYYDQAWGMLPEPKTKDRMGNSELDCILSCECTYGLGTVCAGEALGGIIAANARIGY
ncbi:hypothetical protein [Paenibacillus illinoisensis]|uniref:Uncharacterized protein n=1 Tax=Paenibacillus illinoisensis TaxID=59845 RepID=A0A2W0CM59_9BACL|nr:hypothetical protein [Paenibacillus illinoisensis]PYY31152.1 Uncharacterized protein PIL02S_00233 [Paenibacillus illinoisensis]